MSNELRDILSNSNKDIDNQQLMDYLSSHLNKASEHEVEKAMVNDAFVNDAVEGLQQLQGKQNMQAYVDQLNDELHKTIAKNKKRRAKRRLKDSPYTYLAIIVLLLMLVLCFTMVKRYLDSKKTTAIAAHSKTWVEHTGTNTRFTHL
jgi:ribosome-associated translation inhibitor RaiA